jgi:sarcosine oxidase subunit gamma
MLKPVKTASLRLTLLDRRAVVRLKAWLPDQVLPSYVEASVSEELRVLCVAPDEWLLVSDAMPGSKLRDRIHAVQENIAAVDLSQGTVVLRIEGTAVRDVLAIGCGLDLHPRSFPPGRCARTRFAQLPITLDCRSLNEFELYGGRSYWLYLQAWFIDVAAELEVR